MKHEPPRSAGTDGSTAGGTSAPSAPFSSTANTAHLARWLYERYQERDWPAAEQLLHPDVQLRMPATAEVLDGREAVLGLQVNYPEPWGELRVLRVVGGDPSTVSVEVEIVGPEQVFRCAAFWESHEGRLYRGTEYWVTVGADEPGPR